MDLSLQDKIAMITGASNGLAKESAFALAREGCKVSICARGEEKLRGTVDELTNNGFIAHGTQADITNEEDVKRFHQETIEHLGHPDILVNSVGGRRGSVLFEETSLQQFRDGLEVNLIGAVRLTSMVLPYMRAQKWGRVINIASIYGREHGGSIDYMTAKAGLIAFSKHLALQLVRDNVNVNCIAPGSIDFPGSTWEKFQRNNSPEVVSEFISRNLPGGRFGWPEPVGAMVAFLASDQANLVTGTCINIDGGQSHSLI